MGVSKVIYDGETLIDISEDTVTSEAVFEGITAHNAKGEKVEGTFPVSEVGTQSGLIGQIKTALDGKAAGGSTNIILQKKIATANGVVTADEGYTGLSQVTVDVPLPVAIEETINVTENGITVLQADAGVLFSTVTVNTNVSGGDAEVGRPYIDTSQITDFRYFCSYDKMNDKLDRIDTSKGTNFSNMFTTCTTLTTVPLLETSKGTIFSNMFYGCTALETVPQLNLSKGNSFGNMFYNCTSLKSAAFIAPLINLATTTFFNCTALTDITISEGWSASIYLHYSNDLTVESLHKMIENFADLTGKMAKNFQIGVTNLAKIDEEHLSMLTAKNWNYS